MAKSNFAERLKNTGRNDPCPCGSGKKYKKCHLSGDQEAEYKELKKRQKAAEAAAKAKKEAEEEDTDNKSGSSEKPSATKSAAKPVKTKIDTPANIPRRSAV
jgi:hypothetical protein